MLLFQVLCVAGFLFLMCSWFVFGSYEVCWWFVCFVLWGCVLLQI